MIFLPNFIDFLLNNFFIYQQIYIILVENDCLTKFYWFLKFHHIRTSLRVRVFFIPYPNSNLRVTRGLGFSWRNSSNALIFCIPVHFGQTNIFREFYESRSINKKVIDKCYHLRRRKTLMNNFFIYLQIYIKLVGNDCLTKLYWSVKFRFIPASLRVRVFFIPNPNSSLGVNRVLGFW